MLDEVRRTAQRGDHAAEYLGRSPLVTDRFVTSARASVAVCFDAANDQHFRAQRQGDIVEPRIALFVSQVQPPDSSISSALPAVVPSTSFMSVISACVLSPAIAAVAMMLRASSSASRLRCP